MKIQLHIPTEQYGFIAVEYETDGEIAYEEAAREYQLFADAFKEKEGLSDKEFDQFIEKQLLGEGNHVEEMLKLSPEQNKLVQIIKRALDRIEYRNSKDATNLMRSVTSPLPN